MAYARVQGNAAGAFSSASSIAVTLGAPITSGNTGLGCVTYGSAATLSSVTDEKGNTYTIVDTVTNATDAAKLSSFWLPNITNAPQTITANFSQAVASNQIIVDEFSGVSISATVDGHTAQVQPTPGTGTDGVTSGNITTGSSGDLVWAGTVDQHNTTITFSTGTGYTTGTTAAPYLKSASEFQTQSAAGVIAGTFTGTVNEPVMTCVIALQAPALGTTTTLGMSQGFLFHPGAGPTFELRGRQAFPPAVVPPAQVPGQIGIMPAYLFRPGSGPGKGIANTRNQAFPASASMSLRGVIRMSLGINIGTDWTRGT